jgi:predicted nuclease with TOPRIM domain
MTQQQLQERINLITNEMTQVRANYSKLEGHLAENQHWLSELIKKEAEESLSNVEPHTGE